MRLVSSFRWTSAALAAVAGALFLMSPALPASAMPTPFGGNTAQLQQQQVERVYFWTGYARVISDITHKETFWPGSGTVRATSIEQAKQLAEEAMKAQGSIGGHVLDAHINTLN